MASLAPLPLCVLSYLVLFTFNSSVSAAFNQKVKLNLYYETLCPACSRFMADDLPKIFDNGLISIVNLHLVPYGNAELGDDGTVTCQHGQYECALNMVEACVIYTSADVKKHYPVLHCIEDLVVKGEYTLWKSCFKKTGFNLRPVKDCFNGPLGKQLILRNANETNKLIPPHRFVPWVTVNGEPLEDDYPDFMTAICKAYKGSGAPKICENLPAEVASHQATEVCDAEKPITALNLEEVEAEPEPPEAVLAPEPQPPSV